MEPVKVPQNLELADVLMWGLGAVDLICLALGAFGAWWLYLVVPGTLVARVAAASPVLAIGLGLGAGKLGERSLREWLLVFVRYLARPRRRVYGAGT